MPSDLRFCRSDGALGHIGDTERVNSSSWLGAGEGEKTQFLPFNKPAAELRTLLGLDVEVALVRGRGCDGPAGGPVQCRAHGSWSAWADRPAAWMGGHRGRDRACRRPHRGCVARGRVDGVRDRPEAGQEHARPVRVGGEQGRPVRRLSAGRCVAHRPGQDASPDPRQRGDDQPADECAGTSGPGARPGRDGQPAPRSPADHPARGDRPVPQHRQPHHPGVPAPVPQPGQGRLAVPYPAGQLAGVGRVQPPSQHTPTLGPPARRSPRHHRSRRCGPRARSRRLWSPRWPR